MTTFSIGSFGATGTNNVRGQAFQANVAGPNGSGSPGQASQVKVKTLSIGYFSSSTSGRTMKLYIYSSPLGSPDDIGQSTDLVAESNTGAYMDGAGLFGTGTYSRQFTAFTQPTAMSASDTYYVYFDRDQSARVNANNPYPGGNCYDLDLADMSPYCLQFQVEFDTV